MASVLLTAFEPYDHWGTNASWLCLQELTRELPTQPTITTRLYPVNFAAVRDKLAGDLRQDYDFAIHLGQSPGSSRVRLETMALNIGGELHQPPDQFIPLAEDGPAAYRSSLPLEQWSRKLQAAGIPTTVSFHAGTYLCNATLYWSRYLAERMNLRTRAVLVHLPLDLSQVINESRDHPFLPVATSAVALRMILEELTRL